MTQQTNTNTERMPDWYDPFVEPNTMPKSWDLSEQGYVNRSHEALEHEHSHRQRHEPLQHAHPHVPDAHHAHRH